MPKKPGRKSTASLSVVAFTPGQRLAPPPELTEKQAATWRAVVAAKPADWFSPEHAPTLAEYVRAADAADVIATLIEADRGAGRWETPDGLRRLSRLLVMQARQSGLLVMLARSMRLTQHSTRRADAAATNARPSGRRPWEIGQDDGPA